MLLENIKPSLRYAVRSSACGEDSEETSAAGQMETILGVEGPQQVLQAVTRCWASQFSFTAVQYRRFVYVFNKRAFLVTVNRM